MNAKKAKLTMAKERKETEEVAEVAVAHVVVAAEAEVDAKMLLVRNVLLKVSSLKVDKIMLLVVETESEDLKDHVVGLVKTMATALDHRVNVKTREMKFNVITEVMVNAEDHKLLDLKVTPKIGRAHV